MTRLALLLACLVSSASAFTTPRPLAPAVARSHSSPKPMMAYNEFNEDGMRKFRWNLNVGRKPWGFALNAEVWNGRVAMMGFVWVVLQECITGKGAVTAFKLSLIHI